MIYLDSAATSLLKPISVGRAVSSAIISCSSPGRGGYAPAMSAAQLLYECRCAAASLFDVPEPDSVVLTLNATHALNIAIRSLAGKGSRVLISGFEHNAVTRPLTAVGAEIRCAGTKLFDPDDTLRSFRDTISWAELVVCTHVSNVFGYILPIEEIAALCREKSVPLIIDASQAAGVLPVSLQKTGAAFIAMPGHKALLGPQGTGLLLCAQPGKPLLFGGSGSESLPQEMPDYLPDRLEAGTHNVCGIAGLLAGLRYVRDKGTDAIFTHERDLLALACSRLEDSPLELFCREGMSQSGVLYLRHQHIPADDLAERLAEEGICVRSGLHCAPLAHRSAGTLETGTLRMSFSPFLTQEELARACDLLKRIS